MVFEFKYVIKMRNLFFIKVIYFFLRKIKSLIIFPFFIFRKLIILISQKYNSFETRKIYIYLGTSSDSILHKLTLELGKELKEFTDVQFLDTISNLQMKFIFNNCWVLCVHQSQISKVIKSGVYPSKIITLYTHTRFSDMQEFGLYSRKIKAILSISENEKARLIANNFIDKNCYYFPLGYNPFYFRYTRKRNLENRKFDVLFSLSYKKKFNSNGNEIHYHTRKRYEMLIKVVNKLVSMNYSVCILGSNWSQCEYELNTKVYVTNDNYPEYRKYYLNSKIFCMPSYLEGSPTAIAEAMASSCYLLLSPTGWALDIQPSHKFKSRILNFEANSDDWVKTIIEILENKEELNLTNENHFIREKFLKKIEFKSLALKLNELLIGNN